VNDVVLSVREVVREFGGRKFVMETALRALRNAVRR